MFPSIWAVVTTCLSVTSVPSSASVPGVGRVTIVTLASAAPASVSAKPKSAAVKVYAASSSVVTVLLAAVGAVFVGVVPPVVPLTRILKANPVNVVKLPVELACRDS